MYHIFMFLKESTKWWLPAVFYSKESSCYVTIMGKCFHCSPDPKAYIEKKRPKCREGIDRPRVNGKGKTFCKQMKKREKNGKEKQWLSSQMFTHENKELRIIGYSWLARPPSRRGTDATAARPPPAGWSHIHRRKPVGGAPWRQTPASLVGVTSGVALLTYFYL